MGSAYLLPRIVGLGRATELLMLGDKVTAARAYEIGLATEVVADDAARRVGRRARRAPRRRPGVRLRDDQVAADPRARHGPRAPRSSWRRSTQALLMHSEDFNGVLRGLERGSPARLERTMNEPINPPTLPRRRVGLRPCGRAPASTVYLGRPDGAGCRRHDHRRDDRRAVRGRGREPDRGAAAAPAASPDDLVTLQVFVTDVVGVQALLA